MPASPETYAIASGEPLGAGRFIAPDWAPVAGEIKTISKPAGFFGTNGGAVLAEIDPKYQSWNPLSPAQGPYKGTEYYWGSITGYSGICLNSDTRQLVNYGAGHASINVCAPFCFDLTDLRWKWLDTPLPFDGYGRVLTNGYSAPPSQDTVDLLYENNELDYTWGDLNGDSTAWSTTYGEGPWLRPGVIQPIPGHTRAGMIFIPASVAGNSKGELLYSVTPSGVLSGVNSRASHVFNFDTATWRRTVNQCPFGNSANGRGVAFDIETRTVLLWNGGTSWAVFDYETETWSTKTGNNIPSAADHGGSLIHSPSRLFISPCARNASGESAYYNGVTFDFYAVPIDQAIDGTISQIKLIVVAESTWPLSATTGYNTSIGFAYCPADHCLYAINGSGGSTKYWKLSPPPNATTTGEYLSGTWTLTEHTFGSGALSTASTQSWCYNRLTWDKKSRSFLWFPDDRYGPVQAFRPHGV